MINILFRYLISSPKISSSAMIVSLSFVASFALFYTYNVLISTQFVYQIEWKLFYIRNARTSAVRVNDSLKKFVWEKIHSKEKEFVNQRGIRKVKLNFWKFFEEIWFALCCILTRYKKTKGTINITYARTLREIFGVGKSLPR